MSKIRKHLVMKNKAFNLLFTFFMNKVSEYDTKQLLTELSLGRLNYKELLIREIQKEVRPMNEPSSRVYNKRSNIYTKRRKTRIDDLRNIDLIAYIFSNIKGFVEYQYIRRLTHDDIKNMARFIRYEFYPKDSYIFRQGDRSNKFYGIIDGEVQVVEARYTDKLKALKELMIKLEEREKLSDDDKIFFLSGKNFKDNYNHNYNVDNINEYTNLNYYNNREYTKNKNNLDDDISIKTKKYFVSKISNDESAINIEYNDNINNMDMEVSSISSLSDNLVIEDNNKLIKRSHSCYFLRNNIAKLKYYRVKNIIRIIRTPRRLNVNVNHSKRLFINRYLKTKNIVPKMSCLLLKSIRRKRREHEYRPIKINEKERNNINFLNQKLLYFGKIISDGNYFGDQEMCKKQKRKYSIYSLKDCHLFSLKKEYFDKFILSKIIRSELLKTNFILDKLNVVQKEQHFFKLITKVVPKLYDKGQILYTPFDPADHLYLVYKGECAMCETYKPFNNKNEFLVEKPKMKIIAILNEGGIGGLEGYQKNVNYEKYMIVNSSLTIIIKLDIRDFDDNTSRFRRSLEPLYYQQQRMLFSIQRKGIYFKIGREINKNDKEKLKFKDDIKKSAIYKDKNLFSIKFQLNNKFNYNDPIIKDKENITLFNKKIVTPINTINILNNSNRDQKSSLNNIKTINAKKQTMPIIPNNYRLITDTKMYSPIKLLIKEKKLEIEDTTSILTSFIKESKKHNVSNNQNNLTLESTNIKSFDEYIKYVNKPMLENTVFKQKKYYSFYHQKFGGKPISLKGYFSQEKNDIQINKFNTIKNNILNVRTSLKTNIFQFYNNLSKNLKNNKDKNGKRLSWDKGKTNFPEDTSTEKEKEFRNSNNKLNIRSSIKSRQSFKIRKYPKGLNKNNINKAKTNKIPYIKPKMSCITLGCYY